MIVGPMLEVKGVTKKFGGFTALSDVNVSLQKGERLGLIGPNGSGKTTLMNCIAGTLRLTGGSIVFNQQDVSGTAAYQRARIGIARSFQIPRPFKSMTVVENLLVPLEYLSARRPSRDREMKDEAMSILESMGLKAKADVLPGALTQVELRRMELARALAANPQLLICDESMAGLSNSEVDEILELLFALNAQGITIIMIEHIMSAVMRFSQRLLCLDAGQLVCQGSPSAVVADPHVQRAYLGA